MKSVFFEFLRAREMRMRTRPTSSKNPESEATQSKQRVFKRGVFYASVHIVLVPSLQSAQVHLQQSNFQLLAGAGKIPEDGVLGGFFMGRRL